MKQSRWEADIAARQLFPGEIAGASLKQVIFTSASPGRGTFPGEIAGASLKLQPRYGPAEVSAGFPGEIAGASLKLPRLESGYQS